MLHCPENDKPHQQDDDLSSQGVQRGEQEQEDHATKLTCHIIMFQNNSQCLWIGIYILKL